MCAPAPWQKSTLVALDLVHCALKAVIHTVYLNVFCLLYNPGLALYCAQPLPVPAPVLCPFCAR